MLRTAREADVPAMLAIYAPYVENTTISFEYEPPAPGEFLARFRRVTARFPWLVWEEDGAILGYAYAAAPFERAAYRWCAEPSVYLLPEARGRGIGRRLYRGLEALLLALGYHTLYALVTGENGASLDFHRALGYRHLATMPRCGFKQGRWLDLVWLEKGLKIGESPKAFPLEWQAFVQDAERIENILGSLSLS